MSASAVPQGDLRLLESETAQRLLSSTLLARIAYVATDGTPRVVPTWFHWTGDELVIGTYQPAPKIRALRSNPDVAVSIDTDSQPPEVLSIRGRATVDDADGVVPEYALAARRYLGDEMAAGYLAAVDQPGVRMVRIAVRPTWVGLLDFQTRYPIALPTQLQS